MGKVSKPDLQRWKESSKCKRSSHVLTDIAVTGWMEVQDNHWKGFGNKLVKLRVGCVNRWVIRNWCQEMTLVHVGHRDDGNRGLRASRHMVSLGKSSKITPQNPPGDVLCHYPSFNMPGAAAPRRHELSLCPLLCITVSKFRALNRRV